MQQRRYIRTALKLVSYNWITFVSPTLSSSTIPTRSGQGEKSKYQCFLISCETLLLNQEKSLGFPQQQQKLPPTKHPLSVWDSHFSFIYAWFEFHLAFGSNFSLESRSFSERILITEQRWKEEIRNEEHLLLIIFLLNEHIFFNMIHFYRDNTNFYHPRKWKAFCNSGYYYY